MKAQPRMDADRFRNHYYTKRRVPDWGSSFQKIMFGVEIEYIVHAKGNVDQLMGREDYFEFINTLLEKGYSREFDRHKIGRVSKNTGIGFVKINPDFAYHIVEFSLPPLQCFEKLANEYLSTLEDIDNALSKRQFCRGKESYIGLTEQFDLVTEERLAGSIETFQRNGQLTEYSTPWMAGQISATHVHFNIGTENGLTLLPALYESEWVAQKLFTRPNQINGTEIPSVRTLLYEHTFGSDYQLVNVPKSIPTSVVEYVELYNASKPLFPNDSFFPARDFCVIRPTPYGTFEFRSADTVQSLAELRELIVFRLMQIKYATQRGAQSPAEPGQVRERFVQIAKDSKTPLHSAEKELLKKLAAIEVDDFSSMNIDEAITDSVRRKILKIAPGDV